MNDTKMIKCENIHKSYGTLEVLRGVSLEVSQGEVVSVVGPSGAGKTTLLQIMGTLSPMDSGRLEIDGVDVSSMGDDRLSDFRNRHIGFVFQFHHLLPEFTALENVMMPALIGGTSRGEAERHALELLRMMGLEARASHKPSALSGGEQQRIVIARALLNRPKLILADEPTGNLDPETGQQIVDHLREISRMGTAVLMATHNTQIVEQYPARVLRCDNKQLISD